MKGSKKLSNLSKGLWLSKDILSSLCYTQVYFIQEILGEHLFYVKSSCFLYNLLLIFIFKGFVMIHI